MAKHIHIFLGPKIRAVTTDSPEWDESKHPRADNGQFGKGSGGGAKPAAGAGNAALEERQAAKKAASEQKMAQFNKQKTMMKGKGLTPAAAEKQKIQRQQQQAGSSVAAGLEEHEQRSEEAAKKFPVGSMVRTNVMGSKPERVTGHSGNMIHTEMGQNRMHVTKAVAHQTPAASVSGGQGLPMRPVRGFVATAEKSQFGGYRPHVTHPDGSTARLSQHAFDTPEQAADYAEHMAVNPGVVERGREPPKKPHQFPGYIQPKY